MVRKKAFGPKDVSAEDAARVLEFINSVESAEELAEAVEIPGRPDVGIKIAAAILAKRETTGEFSSLAQIDSIKLIGPGRFADIVETLSRVEDEPANADDEIDEVSGQEPSLSVLRVEIANGIVDAVRTLSSAMVIGLPLAARAGTPTFPCNNKKVPLVTAQPHEGEGQGRTTKPGRKPKVTRAGAKKKAKGDAETKATKKAEDDLKRQQNNVGCPKDCKKVRGEIDTKITKKGKIFDEVTNNDKTITYKAKAEAEGDTWVKCKP